MNDSSFQSSKTVGADQLRERMEILRVFEETTDQYEALVKDRMTGEHYLHHAHIHLNVAEAGAEEFYHAIMPLDPDEVIEAMVGGRRWPFPEAWRKSFLRNGPHETYIWFDPEMTSESNPDEAFGRFLHERLLSFKQAGQFDQVAMSELFEAIEEARQSTEDGREADQI
jgi:hypothetical protein